MIAGHKRKRAAGQFFTGPPPTACWLKLPEVWLHLSIRADHYPASGDGS